MMSRFIRIVCDVIAVMIGASIAYKVRFGSFIISAEYFPIVFVFVVFTHLSLSWVGYYRINSSSASQLNIDRLLSGIFFSSMLITMFLFFTKTGSDFSRLWLGYSAIFSTLLIGFFHFITIQIFGLHVLTKTVLLIGENATAESVYEQFALRGSGIRLLRLPDIQANPEFQGANDGSLLQTAAQALEFHRTTAARGEAISEVWLTHDVYSKRELIEIEHRFVNSAVNVVYIAELPTVHGAELSNIRGFAALNSQMESVTRFKAAIRSTVDWVFALVLLLVLSPLLILIAVAVKFSSPGPVLYKQRRFGVNGSEFNIYKFRSMNVTERAKEFRQATKGDPRVTRVGRVLRKTSLDELPQLLNVLRGEMSLVGPRPHPNLLDEQYRHDLNRYMQRYRVKPGITGLAQIRGFRGETKSSKDMENRLRSDLEYIRNKGLFLDLKILVLTIKHLLGSSKAY